MGLKARAQARATEPGVCSGGISVPQDASLRNFAVSPFGSPFRCVYVDQYVFCEAFGAAAQICANRGRGPRDCHSRPLSLDRASGRQFFSVIHLRSQMGQLLCGRSPVLFSRVVSPECFALPPRPCGCAARYAAERGRRSLLWFSFRSALHDPVVSAPETRSAFAPCLPVRACFNLRLHRCLLWQDHGDPPAEDGRTETMDDGAVVDRHDYCLGRQHSIRLWPL